MFRIVGLVFLLSFQLYSQKISIKDRESNLPIEGGFVFNQDRSVVKYTDEKGIVEISSFSKNETIFINHPQFIEQSFTYEKAEAIEYEFFLEKKTEELDEVVLSFFKGKLQKDKVAEQTFVFTKKEIEKISPQTSADLLAATPGVKVQKSQFGGGSPVIRGMEANRVLLVVDGVRMNNAIYRKGHLQNSITVAPTMLERVEVLFGPSSVMYGSDALGGVVHYYTKTLRTSKDPTVNSTLFSRVSSINNEFTGSGAVELSFKKWASYTSVSYSSFGDLRMGKNRSHGYEDWGKVFRYSDNSEFVYNASSVVNENPSIQKNTGFSQKDFLQKLYFSLSKKTELLFNFQYSTSSDIPRFDKLTETKEGELKYAEWFYGPQKRLLLSSQLKFSELNDWLDKGVLTFAYQDIEESRINRKFSSIDKRSYGYEDVDVFSINGDFSVSLGREKNKTVSYGFETAFNKVASEAYGKVLKLDPDSNAIIGFDGDFAVQSRYPDGGSNYLNQAFYIGYRQDVLEKHTINTGVRWTYTQLNARWEDTTFIELPESDVSLFNNAITVTLGDIYRLNNTTRISAVLSSGFRSPNIDDIGKVREKNGKVTVPNTSLKPEYAYNSEIGFVKDLKNKTFTISGNTYYTLLKDYIIRAPYSVNGNTTVLYEEEEVELQTNINRGNAYIFGGTLGFNGEFTNNWFTAGAITYTEGRTYDTDGPLSSIPPLFGNLLLGYRRGRIETIINYEFNGVKKASDYNLEEGIDNIEQTPIVGEDSDPDNIKYAGTPSWSVIGASVKYEYKTCLELLLQVDNVLDKHYKEFASGLSAPGRNFSLSAKYMF